MTELPTTISVSKEAYRMFRSMCKGTDETEVGVAPEPKKKSEVAAEKPFSNATQAFLIAVAIGILKNEKAKPSDSAQLIRGEYLRKDKNYAYFKQLIKSRFGAKTDHDIASLMTQFAEFGVRELYNEYHKIGDIDFIRLSKLSILTSS